MGKTQRRECYIAFLLIVCAAICRFLLQGYSFLALMLAACAAALVLHAVLPRALKRVLVILIAVWLVIFTIFLVPVVQASKGNATRGADYLIVLGAKVNGKNPSLALQERLLAAKAYLDRNPDCIAIVSGAQGEDEEISEAACMHNWLTSHGIDDSRIRMELKATNTEENIANSLAMIDDPQDKHIIVASSEFHLRRAELLAERLGVTVEGLPAKTSHVILRWSSFAREACGLFLTKLLYLKASL